MPLVTSKELLLDAQKNGYAVGAFNVENMEMGQAIVMAAEELNAPVILQTTPSTIRYASVEMYHAIVDTLAKKASVPVVMHLDHGDSYALAVAALGAGYTSVMIDGSHESFENNIALTKSVVEQAHTQSVPVEAELGKVGGKEDDLDGGSGGYTDPAEAREFAERTGISSLAVAIGTAHGIYSGTPVLDVERLREIRKVVSIPLVLHGASGLLDKDIIECVKAGICKVNFATELRIAFSNGIKRVLTETPDVFDPKKYGKVGRDYVVEAVKTRILVCGADGKA